MKTIVNIHAAKTHLSRLIARAASGEEILIARNGQPVARLVALEARPAPRAPGLFKGKIEIRADFDGELPPALLAAFHAGEIEPSTESE